MAEGQKKINIDQVVNYLNHAFSKATQNRFPQTKNHKGTDLYNYQVQFCYLIDDIQRGPRYIVPKLITEANELIAEIEGQGTEESKGA